MEKTNVSEDEGEIPDCGSDVDHQTYESEVTLSNIPSKDSGSIKEEESHSLTKLPNDKEILSASPGDKDKQKPDTAAVDGVQSLKSSKRKIDISETEASEPCKEETKVKKPKPIEHKKLFEKNHPFVYLKVKLSIHGSRKEELTKVQYRFHIMQALRQNMGVVGMGSHVDILKLMEHGIALLRVQNSNIERIWSALTLYGIAGTGTDQRLAFTVLKMSPFLIDMAMDSRDYFS